MLKENNNSFESEVSTNQDLHFEYLASIINSKGIIFNESKYNNRYFTNLALLLSDECPFTIKCAIFEGNDKTTFKDRKEFSGSLIKQL